VVNNKGNNKII